MKKPNIEQIEQDIEITLAFLYGDLTKEQWTYYVAQLHGLSIKLAQAKGESPIVASHKPEHIIKIKQYEYN